MTPDAPMPALTPKQRRFVEEYLLDMCAGKAAIRAGYSKKTANQQGHILLDHAGIKAAIDTAKIKRSERTEIDSDWTLKRLVEEAEADLADLYDKNNNLKPIDEWPAIWRQGLVAGVEVNAHYEGHGDDRIQVGETTKLRLSDRVRRLELIGKHIRPAPPTTNPDDSGVVRAIDITHDPKDGFDSYAFADPLLKKQDRRLKYIISNRLLFRPHRRSRESGASTPGHPPTIATATSASFLRPWATIRTHGISKECECLRAVWAARRRTPARL